ncbi:hypothetical protein NP233_g5873 [Leucocoprinus birnbaumii]|uniref:Transmembrane protein n=1 Tax=Leucocoprinus birnbaumii TaxID=56174 RepID=A0AAD5YQI9_9AGAR|nr:hypothetical protein NP233_g5873 [Leucocoprinus birnbaumii]
MIIATVAEVYDAAVTTTAVFDKICTDARLMPPNPFVGDISIVFMFMNIVTDGLLVWRCYAIATGLYGRKWLLAWAAPLTIYLGMIVTAVISSSNPRAAVSNGLITAQFAISLSLNVTISTSIIILLLYYKRMTTEVLGRDAAKAYLNIMTMLLESGSLIVVIDVIAIATVRGSAAGYVAFQMWVNLQPIASFLIIYQVARGVDYFNRKAEITKVLAKAAASDYDTTHVGFRDEQRGSDLSLDTLV